MTGSHKIERSAAYYAAEAQKHARRAYWALMFSTVCALVAFMILVIQIGRSL